VKILFF